MNAEELEQELQTLEHFEEWLKTQKGQIGAARDNCNCPLANYLSQQIDARIEVGCNGIAIGDGRVRHTRLSYEFTRQIDDGRRNNQKVTATVARNALKAARNAISRDRMS